MTNTKRRIICTIDVEADDHDSGPLSDVTGFVKDDILGRFGSEVSEKLWASVTQRMKDRLLRFLGDSDHAFSDMVEQAIIDNISSEGWSILEIAFKITDPDGSEEPDIVQGG